MSNKPINTFKFKGIQLNDWGSGKFTLKKQYFKKEGDSGQWVDTNSYFKNELEELRKLIDQALEAPQVNPLDEYPNCNPKPADFDDSDIPF